MKKLVFSLLLLSLLAWPAISGAAPRRAVDVATITCAQVMDSTDNPAALGMLLGWLDGYTSARSGNTLISPPWMAKIGLRITSYCSKNPDGKIMDAMRTMLP